MAHEWGLHCLFESVDDYHRYFIFVCDVREKRLSMIPLLLDWNLECVIWWSWEMLVPILLWRISIMQYGKWRNMICSHLRSTDLFSLLIVILFSISSSKYFPQKWCYFGNALVRLHNKGRLLEHHALVGKKMDKTSLINYGVYAYIENLLSLHGEFEKAIAS